MAHAKNDLHDFGFEPAQSQHHFAVVIGRSGEVRIEERFSWADDEEDEIEPEVKARLDGYYWGRITTDVQTQFNQRLRREGLKAARWMSSRDTLLAPDFGRELVLLAWAVEDTDPSVIPNIVANWTGLAPEERWWLYTTINATSGHAEHGKERGWRKAIRIAFAENPVFVSPASFLADRLPIDDELRSNRRRRRGKKKELVHGQLSLIDEEEPSNPAGNRKGSS
jgi:hypothetical protein